VRAFIQDWTRDHTVAEVIDLAASFRVPAAPVLDGATLPHFEPLTERSLFDRNPRGDLPHPRPPFRSSATSPRAVRPAPAVDEHADRPFAAPRAEPVEAGPGGRDGRDEGRRPLEGVRILDVTAFWAGPSGMQYLASLGADVIKVESVQRPDAMRFNVGVPPDTDQWWEQGYLYVAANLDKRGITLNLGDPRGRTLFLQLVALSDVVVENYTPRVIEHFGLTYEVVSGVRPDIVMVRMPGWGLDGPWRDRPGFATTMEQAAGMAFVTGYEDGPPSAPGLCDPLMGIHGAFAVLAALEERRRTGRGQHVELSMIDMAVNVAAEQILEHAAYGSLMTRRGNRSDRSAPQGVYRCAGADEWLALSVSSGSEWRELCRVIGATGWLDDPDLASVAGRHAAHDRLDAEIAAWCAGRPLAAAAEALSAAGAEPVAAAFAIDEDEQMRSRGFWETVDHPVVGAHRYPGWPMRLSGGPTGWHRWPAPLIGEHNEDVLTGLLGLDAAEIADLREADVIGERPLGL
jgi:crotonobetainyl-CoA:carnitine CoA-transferase CaiB-like acyl-CoA transferase